MGLFDLTREIARCVDGGALTVGRSLLQPRITHRLAHPPHVIDEDTEGPLPSRHARGTEGLARVDTAQLGEDVVQGRGDPAYLVGIQRFQPHGMRHVRGAIDHVGEESAGEILAFCDEGMEALLGKLVTTFADGQPLFGASGLQAHGEAREAPLPLVQAITQVLLQAAVELVEALGLLLQPSLGILMIEPLLQQDEAMAGGDLVTAHGLGWRPST